MLKKREDSEVQMSAADFAKFNQNLFFDPTLPPDEFLLPPPSPQLLITPGELRETLQKNFKANKSTGLSKVPLQLLKHLGGGSVACFANFLNNSAVKQLPPASWRCSKVVPLYKGAGDPSDFNNYRSIAVTPPFTKIFMSIMNKRLTNHAEKNGLHAPT
jgi:hypothetical protein